LLIYSRLLLLFRTWYGLIAYIEHIAFDVYSVVQNDCLYTTDCVWCLQRGTDCLLIYSRLRLVFTARYVLIACIE